jgi:hypothetical protein
MVYKGCQAVFSIFLQKETHKLYCGFLGFAKLIYSKFFLSSSPLCGCKYAGAISSTVLQPN